MRVNGRKVTITEGESLLHFLEREGYGVRHVAVELNGEIVRSDEFGGISLADGDAVEIVCFVGGGV